jgi:pilus assembly protein CpaC
MIYDFRLDVKKSNLTKVANEMKALLNDIEGISIKVVNNRVVVDGQVLLPRDLSRIISVVGQFGDQLASSLVTLSPIAQKKIAHQIANDINNPEISVRAVADKFILEGTAQDQSDKDRADQIAQVYVPDVVREEGEINGKIVKIRKSFIINLINVKAPPPKDPGKIIQLVVHYVELSKEYEKMFRFQFMPTLQDNSSVSFVQDSRQPGGIVSTITGTVSNLLPKLNWAKSHGHARILQSSSLIVLDGQKGDIKNQTRVPYQTANQLGQPITQFEETGFVTSITPAILNARSDSIRLNMDFSMKALVGLTDKGPLTTANNMTTVIIVRSGQSAAVGGLISNSTSTNYNKLPKNNGADPIVSLFASKGFQRNQSQFVVFVTPIIKSSASQGAEKVKQKFRLRD